MSPHSDRHPSGNEKCCSLAFCYPSAPKAWIGRGAQRGRRRRRSLVPSSGRNRAPSRSSFTELAVCPAKISPPAARAVGGKMGSSAGSTRLSKNVAQCSRGSRDDRSERAPPCPSAAPQGAGDTRSARQLLLSATKGDCWRLRLRAFTGAALEISFVARRGEHPGVPDRIGLQGVLLGEIDLFTGVVRACGNALGLTREPHVFTPQ